MLCVTFAKAESKVRLKCHSQVVMAGGYVPLIRFSISWQFTSIDFLLWVKLPLSILDRSKPKKQAAPVSQFVSLTDVNSEVLTNSPKWRTILTIRLGPLLVFPSNPVSHAFRQLDRFRWWLFSSRWKGGVEGLLGDPSGLGGWLSSLVLSSNPVRYACRQFVLATW